MLKRQDPTLQVQSSETGQMLISGMGELHLEIIKNRLLRDFNLNVKFHKPQVSYRESVAKSVQVVGECNRIIAGQQLFAKVRVRMEPVNQAAASAAGSAAAGGKSASPVMILNQCPPEALPPERLAAALEELKACGEGGGRIAGFPLMKLKLTVLGAEYSPEQTDERAIKIAASDAFEKGLE